MAHVLLFTKGTAGDLIPFLEIGRIARARGHRVTLLSHARYAAAARRADLPFVALDAEADFERFVLDGPLLNQPRGIPEFFRRHCLPRVRCEYERIVERCGRDDTVLVARHVASIADLLMAETGRMPVVRLFTAASQVATFGLVEELFQHVLAADVNGICAAIGLSGIDDWRAWLAAPADNIGGWPWWFAPGNPADRVTVRAVGFLQHDPSETGDLPPRARARLRDGGLPPILISGGTGVFLGAAFYAAAAAACRLLNRRALLVTRHRELVPTPLPEGVEWFASLPFADVMPRVAAVIHHGGVGTLARALLAGTPQFVLPMGGDRPDNAARLRQLGVGDYLLPFAWGPRSIAAGVRELLASRDVRARCRALAQRMAAERPGDAACDVIDAALCRRTAPATLS